MAALLTVKECLDRLPILISERSLRQKIREAGCYCEHRRQIFLTEDHFEQLLESMEPCHSRSNQEGKRGPFKSKGHFKGSEYEKALERLAED